jgi:hypothetical protein
MVSNIFQVDQHRSGLPFELLDHIILESPSERGNLSRQTNEGNGDRFGQNQLGMESQLAVGHGKALFIREPFRMLRGKCLWEPGTAFF